MTNFKMSILAKHIMTPNPVLCYRYNCLNEVMNIMGKEDEKVPYIIVTDENRALLGILSKWNIIRFMLKFNLSEENLSDIPVNNIMKINVTSKDINTSFEDVIESIVETDSECIICTEIEKGKISASVKGIIGKRDVLEGIYNIILNNDSVKRNFDKIIAGDIMNKRVKEIGICYRDEDVVDVKKRMAENNIKHIVVVDETNNRQRIVKVISYKDIIDITTSKKIGEIKTKREEKILNEKLDEKVLITCFKDTKSSELVETMINCRVGVIPVIDNDTLVGIIGRKEIFEAFLLALDEYKKDNGDIKFEFNSVQERERTHSLQRNVNTIKIDNSNAIQIPRFAVDIIPEMQRHYGVICCAPNEKVWDVGLRMKNNNISHIVITSDGTDNGALLSVISARDITIYRRVMAAAEPNIDATPISDLANPLTSSILYCSKYTSFSEMIEKMIEEGIGSMIVTDKGKVDIEEEISNIKKNLQKVEEEIIKEIESTKTKKIFEILGEEYARIVIESNNPNPDVTKISSNIGNIFKTYFSLIDIKQGEETIEKFKNIFEKELLSFMSKIPEEKFNSQEDLKDHLKKQIDDLKNYMKSIGITKQEEQLKVVEEIIDEQKNALIHALEGDFAKAINDFGDDLIGKITKKTDINLYHSYVLKRKINNISNDILKIQLESQNVEDKIKSINAELTKILQNTGIKEDKLEDCRTIMAKTLWIIAESHKKSINLKIVSDRFADILKIYIESAYNEEDKAKIIEAWDKKAKDIGKNFRYGLSKIVMGKIIGFISRSDVLRGIKIALSFFQLPFIEENLGKDEKEKIYAKAGEIAKNKEIIVNLLTFYTIEAD